MMQNTVLFQLYFFYLSSNINLQGSFDCEMMVACSAAKPIERKLVSIILTRTFSPIWSQTILSGCKFGRWMNASYSTRHFLKRYPCYVSIYVSLKCLSLWLQEQLTVSNKMFEALKSRYITGFSMSWRKAKPFAASIAICSLVDQGKVAKYPAK